MSAALFSLVWPARACAFCAGDCVLNFPALRLARAVIKSTAYSEYLTAVVRRWAGSVDSANSFHLGNLVEDVQLGDYS
jgi:hypothetical protein